MKPLYFFLSICLLYFFTSCGSKSCEVADWVGTYTLDPSSVETGCGQVEDFDPIAVIAAGVAEGTIVLDGKEVAISNDCTSISEWFDLELDGDELKVRFEECTLIYK